LAGNNREASADVVDVVLGDFSQTITFEADEFESDFETFTFGFTTLEAGTSGRRPSWWPRVPMTVAPLTLTPVLMVRGIR